MIISNSSITYTENPKQLLNRFVRGEKGKTGIGLAIVDHVCKVYGFQLDYTITKDRTHTISISFG